ncbi:unnamed protein product, partial [Staurois parvus]
MTPFCKVDSPIYFIRGTWQVFGRCIFFVIIFRKIKKLKKIIYILSP